MNFTALNEFIKYTLALAAASIVYVLEKFSATSSSTLRWFVLGILATLLASSLLGLLAFAGGTAALHDDVKPDRKTKIVRLLRPLGTSHTALLFIALVGIAVLVVHRVLSPT